MFDHLIKDFQKRLLLMKAIQQDTESIDGWLFKISNQLTHIETLLERINDKNGEINQ